MDDIDKVQIIPSRQHQPTSRMDYRRALLRIAKLHPQATLADFSRQVRKPVPWLLDILWRDGE